MPSRSSGNIEFDMSFRKSGGRPADPDTPFCIAVLGDFSGRRGRGICETGDALAVRKPMLVDVDNLEDLMARLGAAASVPGGEGPVSLQFNELEDFHPDQIYRNLEVFRALRGTRKRLNDPASFAEAAAEVRAWAGAGPPETPQPAEEAPAQQDDVAGAESEVDTLQRLLGKPVETDGPRPSTAPPPVGLDVNALIKRIIQPDVVPSEDPQKGDLLEVVDEAIAAQMRAVLHDPGFQALEGAWRSVHFLISNLELDEELKLYLVDLSQDALVADLASAEDLRTTGTYRLLVERSVGGPGAQPWAVLAGLYDFGQDDASVATLARLAQVAREAGAPFFAAAVPGVVGCESLAETPEPEKWRTDGSRREVWDKLRGHPDASYLGLALPRFLLRQPYGPDSDPIDAFEFEELPDAQPHESYLWGNPSIACACLLGQSFMEHGWDLRPGVIGELGALPVHTFKTDGETEMKPCAEAWLTDRAAEQIASEGLIPLLSVRNRDSVQVFRFQSLAQPPALVAGKWG